MKKPAYVFFIDLNVAFDHEKKDLMFKTVYHRLTPTSNKKPIQLMESLYSHIKVALYQTLDVNLELRMGHRQGAPEFPPLFNLFMDFVMLVS